MTRPGLPRSLAMLGVLALVAGGGARLAPALSGASREPTGAETSDTSALGDARSTAPRDIVLIELFTSQGCSSCPPADRLLTRLGESTELDGVRVVPLSFHVDYWNYIGWTDPFSSAIWSKRQQRYGRRFDLRSIYTPQLVVQGASECVGSNEREVRGLIEAAARRDPGVRIALESRSSDPRELELRVSAEPHLAGPGRTDTAQTDTAQTDTGQIEAWVALFENDLSTAVGKGENARRTLRNDHVVRRLERAFALDPSVNKRREAEMKLDLDDSWTREHLGAVAFLQDSATLAILDVALLDAGELWPATAARH